MEADKTAVPTKERHQLVATVYPSELDPIPEVEWATTNASVAKVGPTGIVSIKSDGEATITATAVRSGVQGFFQIGTGAESPLTIAPDRPLAKPGDRAKMVAAFAASLKTDSDPFAPPGTSSGNKISIVPNEVGIVPVYWSSSNGSVARIAPETGEIEILKPGTAVITATLADGSQASCAVEIR